MIILRRLYSEKEMDELDKSLLIGGGSTLAGLGGTIGYSLYKGKKDVNKALNTEELEYKAKLSRSKKSNQEFIDDVNRLTDEKLKIINENYNKELNQFKEDYKKGFKKENKSNRATFVKSKREELKKLKNKLDIKLKKEELKRLKYLKENTNRFEESIKNITGNYENNLKKIGKEGIENIKKRIKKGTKYSLLGGTAIGLGSLGYLMSKEENKKEEPKK